jgi:hypothetical protein
MVLGYYKPVFLFVLLGMGGPILVFHRLIRDNGCHAMSLRGAKEVIGANYNVTTTSGRGDFWA